MKNGFKTRISRMFRSSFGSCKTAGNLSDVVEKAVFVPQNQNDKYYYDVVPFPSICRPKCSPTTTNSIFPRQKISSRYPPFLSTNFNGHFCPPASPVSPLNPFYKEFHFNKTKQKKKRSNKKKNNNRRYLNLFSSSSQDSAYFESNYWFNSDDEEESDTLFSSRSTLSSDSSGSHHRHSRRRKYSSRRRRRAKSSSQTGTVLPLNGKVKDSFAVVKSSSDPYNDFRTSMVEMIVEKHMFSAKDLEQLLQCFLSLNSSHHHRIIVEVFTEIYEALFSNRS